VLEWKLWPRGCALAECLWCGPARKPSYEDFLRRLEVHRARLVADGVNAAPLPPPQP
jgi:hexosaminidase